MVSGRQIVQYRASPRSSRCSDSSSLSKLERPSCLICSPQTLMICSVFLWLRRASLPSFGSSQEEGDLATRVAQLMQQDRHACFPAVRGKQPNSRHGLIVMESVSLVKAPRRFNSALSNSRYEGDTSC